MEESEVEPIVRRKRRKSSRKKSATWTEYWRSDEFGRHLFVAMALVGVAYAGTILWQTRFASFNYPPAAIGATESEVRYMLGQPRAVEEGGSLYRFSEKGREIAVRLSSSGRMASISCAGVAEEPSSCPEIRGIGIGSNEYDVLRRFGVPSRESYRGNDKTMYYDGMGMAFQLRRFEVQQLELHEGASFSGYFPRALYSMIP